MISSFFTGITAKVAAFFAVLSGVFFMVIRYQSNKNDRLEHENKTINKKSEMQEESAVIKARIIADEQEQVMKLSKELTKDEKPSLDDINRM